MMFASATRKHRTAARFDETPKAAAAVVAAAASAVMEDDAPPATSTPDAIRALLASMPGQAMRQLDEWTARVVACPPMEAPTPSDAYAVERRLGEAAGFARAWQALRAQTPAHFSQEHVLFEA